jgi:hypothetical protein
MWALAPEADDFNKLFTMKRRLMRRWPPPALSRLALV